MRLGVSMGPDDLTTEVPMTGNNDLSKTTRKVMAILATMKPVITTTREYSESSSILTASE